MYRSSLAESSPRLLYNAPAFYRRKNFTIGYSDLSYKGVSSLFTKFNFIFIEAVRLDFHFWELFSDKTHLAPVCIH